MIQIFKIPHFVLCLKDGHLSSIEGWEKKRGNAANQGWQNGLIDFSGVD